MIVLRLASEVNESAIEEEEGKIEKRKADNSDVVPFNKAAVKSGTLSSMCDSSCSFQVPSSGTLTLFPLCSLNFHLLFVTNLI